MRGLVFLAGDEPQAECDEEQGSEGGCAMRNSTTTTTTMIWPRVGDHLQLLALWVAVIALSLIYWEACRLAHGADGINLSDSGLWMVEIWSGWVVLSFPAFARCRRWRSSPAGISLRQVLALMAVLSVLSFSCEWALNMLLSQHGGIERWDSAWALFNRRALLCVVVSGAIVWLAVRPSFVWRKLGGAEPSPADSPQSTGGEATLLLMDRGRSFTVALEDVEAILAAENYVEICMANGKQHLHRMTLAGIERELDARRMLRVHRSAIVNVDKVCNRLPGWHLQLTSGRTVRVSRSFREAFEQRMPKTDSQ
jgi:hypothetical protein